jgi:single-stranded DNA-binding protein
MVDIIKEANEGDIVGVQGELRSESWEQNGEKRYKTVVVCNRINVETDEVF